MKNKILTGALAGSAIYVYDAQNNRKTTSEKINSWISNRNFDAYYCFTNVWNDAMLVHV